MIEIDGQDREARALRPGAIEGLREADREDGAVRQIRQRVVVGEMGDLLVSRQQLRARRVHLLARLVEPERRLLHLLLEDVEAFAHLAEFVVRQDLDRHDVDRHMRSVEVAAPQGRHGVGEFSQHARTSIALPPR